MDLNDAYQLLNFYINKEQGAYYTPEQLDLVVDRAQMALFNDYYLQYSVDQRLAEALSPFTRELTFINSTAPSGSVILPNDLMHILAINTIVNLPGRTLTIPVPILNVDEKAARDNSQVVPLTILDPYAIRSSTFSLRIYPALPATGSVHYLARPFAPQFVYTIISGRVIVYNQAASTQLSWRDNDVVSILIKALSYLGINMSEQDIIQYAEQKNQLNINTKDKL